MMLLSWTASTGKPVKKPFVKHGINSNKIQIREFTLIILVYLFKFTCQILGRSDGKEKQWVLARFIQLRAVSCYQIYVEHPTLMSDE